MFRYPLLYSRGGFLGDEIIKHHVTEDPPGARKQLKTLRSIPAAKTKSQFQLQSQPIFEPFYSFPGITGFNRNLGLLSQIRNGGIEAQINFLYFDTMEKSTTKSDNREIEIHFGILAMVRAHRANPQF